MRRSQILSVIVIAAGLIVLLGWLTGNQIMMRLLPGLLAMKANTAICFVFFGVALFLHSASNQTTRLMGRAAALAGGAIAVLTLLEIFFGFNFGIDEFLFVDTIDPTGTAAPGRMAPLSAICFTALTVVLLFGSRLPNLVRQLGLIGVLAIALSGFTSYPLSLLTGGGVYSASGMALNTAILFMLLSVAYIFEYEAFQWMSIVVSRTPLGDSTRTLLVTAALVPFLLGWLIFAAESTGFLDADVARLYYSIGVMLIMGVLVLFNAQRLAAVESSNRMLQTDFASMQKQLQSFVEYSPAAIFVKDAEGRYELVNGHFERLVSKSREQITGKKTQAVFPRYLWQKVLDTDRQVLETKAVVTSEIKLEVSGSDHTYLNTNFPILAPDGRVRAIGGTWIDITEQQQLAETLNLKNVDLERSNKELEQFAYVASHDLQEPLRMVSSYMQLLESRYKDKLDSDASEFIGYAVDGAERMQRLIQDLLAFSRIGTRGKQPELVSSEEALTQALQNLKVRIEESKADVRQKDLPEVLADKNQLTQVFQNLLGNAMKFSGDKPPRIDIAAKKADGFAEFSVKDHGIGFEPRHADRIFVLFQRLNSREVYEGTGIGLAICKKIVERHGGRIWAESQVGKGATFYFTFPLQPEVLPEEQGSEDYDLPEEVAESVEERAGRLI